MLKETFYVLVGNLVWNWLRYVEKLDDSKVVLVLTGENVSVDDFAIKYLDMLIDRKYAKEALIIASQQEILQKVQNYKHFSHKISIRLMAQNKIDVIYKRYCFDRISANIFFTYVDKTKDNLLGRFIRETDIDARDVVCLAIYNFRYVPEDVQS